MTLNEAVRHLEQHPPYTIERRITPERTTCFIMYRGGVLQAMSGPDADAVTARAQITCGRLNYQATGVQCSPVTTVGQPLPVWVTAQGVRA